MSAAMGGRCELPLELIIVELRLIIVEEALVELPLELIIVELRLIIDDGPLLLLTLIDEAPDDREHLALTLDDLEPPLDRRNQLNLTVVGDPSSEQLAREKTGC